MYLRAENPPKSAPDPIPTQKPIMKPILTLSKQEGPEVGCIETGILVTCYPEEREGRCHKRHQIKDTSRERGFLYQDILRGWYCMFLYNSFNWFSKILTLIKEIFRQLTVFSWQSTRLSFYRQTLTCEN